MFIFQPTEYEVDFEKRQNLEDKQKEINEKYKPKEPGIRFYLPYGDPDEEPFWEKWKVKQILKGGWVSEDPNMFEGE